MVRHSKKQQLLNRLEDIQFAAFKHALKLKQFGSSSSLAKVEDFIHRVDAARRNVESNRYLTRRGTSYGRRRV